MNETPEQPKRRGRPPGSKNRTEGFMGRKRRKSRLSRIADKVATQPSRDILAVKQLVAAGGLLRALLRDQVEGLDGNDLLRDALALHESAEQSVAVLYP